MITPIKKQVMNVVCVSMLNCYFQVIHLHPIPLNNSQLNPNLPIHVYTDQHLNGMGQNAPQPLHIKLHLDDVDQFIDSIDSQVHIY